MKKDIVIIVPSCDSASTIEHVLKTIDRGFEKHYPKKDCLIVIYDQSDKKTQEKIKDIATDLKTEIVTLFGPKKGKGYAMILMMEEAAKYNPECIACFDSDLRSIKPTWIYLMCERVVGKKADFITPNYIRHKFDGTITNSLIYPVCTSLFGYDIRQPIGGEFAFSGKLYKYLLKKELCTPEVNRFGIDIWFTLHAIGRGFRLAQANLGVKVHDPSVKDPRYPEKSIGNMFYEVCRTTFEMIIFYENFWIKRKDILAVDKFGPEIMKKPELVNLNFKYLWKAFERTSGVHKTFWRKNLPRNCYERIEFLLWIKDENYEFTQDFWVDLFYEFVLLYKKAKSEKQKANVIGALMPLYLGRTACFALETRGMNEYEAEGKFKNLTRIFLEKKPQFIKKWKIA